MRCPKCGYNSFDHLDSCKKCGKDLVEFKQSFGIKSVLFPGQMGVGSVDEVETFDDAAADAAVSVATGVTAAATATAVSDLDGGVTPTGADGDDFGFDFMGDSADDDDLSFDELFEEAPEDEDIEETIEGPREAKTEAADSSGEDFSFDLPEDEADLEDDFGFDPEDEPEDSGSEEDPKRPFDLPESSQFVGAPEDRLNILEESSSPVIVAGKSVDLPLGEAGLPPEELSEKYVFELDEVPAPPPPIEPPVPVSTTSDPVVEVTVPSDAAAASVPAQAVQGDISDEVVSGVAASSPPLVLCVKAFVYDLILLAVVGVSFVVAAETAMATGGGGFLPSLETLINLSVPYFLVLFFLAFGYFTLFHFLVGQTPGKMLTGLRVETTEGEPLAFAQAFLRSVGGLLQLMPVGLGYLVVLFNSERRGWNDQLAGTRVVNLRDPSREN